MGGVGRVACQGFLVREACVNVLERGNGFLLSGSRCFDEAKFAKEKRFYFY